MQQIPQLTDPGEIARLVTERVEPERAQYERPPSPEEKPSPFRSEEILDALHSNEDGDADLFIKLYRERFCYDHAAAHWYKLEEHFWKEDTLNEVTTAIQSVINLYAEEAKKQAWNRVKCEKAGEKHEAGKHEKFEAELLKRIRLLQTRARKENVLPLARAGADSLGITGEEWDRDPWLLGCLNGVIDLRTGEHRPGQPEDFIKTYSQTDWRGLYEPTPTWDRFLIEIFSGDRELIAYIQRVCGYSITGRTIEHILVILWGCGRNGKGTFLEILAFTLGGYAGQVEAELILKQRLLKPSGGPTSDIMGLRGKRLVWASETDEGRKVNAGKIKWLTGGDTLTGREMYGRRQVSFRPSHKLFLLTNHKPHANADDYALWKRIHLIPFTKSFVTDPKEPNELRADLQLPDKLKAEASGILAWLVRGCLAWQQEGLNPPATVKTATEEYRLEEDTIRIFIDECCETTGEVQAGKLYAAFKTWCEENGIRPVSGVVFGKQIKERFDHYESRNRVYYVGLDVRGC